MIVEQIAIAELSPDPANARRHNAKNIETIVASLRRFGQQKPIVIDASNVVRAGNGQLEAARILGWETIDVVRTDLKGSEATAYAIADNRTAELAEWDDEILLASLEGLAIDDADLLIAAGFGEDELRELAEAAELDEDGTIGEILEDEVPEPPHEPVTKPGDLWILGNHRVLCGDSTMAEHVDRLMNGRHAECVASDPPYGVDYSLKNEYLNKSDKGNSNQTAIKNDALSPEALQSFLGNVFSLTIAHCKDGGAWYITAPPGQQFKEFATELSRCGIWRQTLVWVKGNFVLGRSDYKYQHEPIFYGWKPGAAHRWRVGNCESSVIEDFKPPDVSKMKKPELLSYVIELISKIREVECSVIREPKPAISTDHPTTKPVKLFARFIRNSTQRGDVVHDPFLGSGTTLIAAEQLGRTCYGMEISPAYCDVIVKRWETLTGEKALLCPSATPA